MIPADLSPLWISLATATCATALAFVLGIAAAAAMHRYQGRARGLLDGLLTLPLVLPPTVVGFLLLLLLGRRSAIGAALEQIGLRIAFSWPATVVAATVVAFPLMYRAALGAFDQVNPNLMDAARTLGATEWRAFRRVLLPLARPGLVAGTVLTFARALGEFGATLMLAGNIPGRTQTMPVAIFFAAEGGDMRGAVVWVVFIIALSLLTIAGLNYKLPVRRRAPGIAEERARPHLTCAEIAGDAQLMVDVQRAFDGFDLRIAFSSTSGPLGLLGASGSGKSMTLRCIAGLVKPATGRVVLNGRVLFDSASGVDVAAADRRIGMVFQDYALFPHLTVRENIAFGAKAHDVAHHWAATLQIAALLDRYPGELSGGQRQRVALARALAMQPDALLLDEPLSALDPHLRRRTEEQLRAALADYRGGIVFVTHDRDEAFRFCRELAVVHEGRVAGLGEKHEVFARPRTVAVARLTGCKNIARVEEWGPALALANDIDDRITHIGIRAHDVRVGPDLHGENTFACELINAIESPFETTLYLRLDHNAVELEAEISRDAWAALRAQPQPWRVAIDPSRLLFLTEA